MNEFTVTGQIISIVREPCFIKINTNQSILELLFYDSLKDVVLTQYKKGDTLSVKGFFVPIKKGGIRWYVKVNQILSNTTCCITGEITNLKNSRIHTNERHSTQISFCVKPELDSNIVFVNAPKRNNLKKGDKVTVEGSFYFTQTENSFSDIAQERLVINATSVKLLSW